MDGYASGVVATNSTKVRLAQLAAGVGACPTSGGACLAVQPFALEYEDAWGEHWTLQVPYSVWAP